MTNLEEQEREVYISEGCIQVDIKYKVSDFYFNRLEKAYKQIEQEPNLHYEPIGWICRLRFRVTSKEELDHKLIRMMILYSGLEITDLNLEAAKILL